MDIEGYEYDVLTSMMMTMMTMVTMGGEQNHQESSAMISLLPQQIQVELHWSSRMTGLPWRLRTRTSAEVALFSAMMFNAGGYIPILIDYTPYCPPCMEVLYFRLPSSCFPDSPGMQ